VLRAVRFLVVLLAGLAVLALGGYWQLTSKTRAWFESDLQLRTRLVVASARQSLISHWSVDGDRLLSTLADIARDERIMAAAACSDADRLLAATEAFPGEFSCSSVRVRMKEELALPLQDWAFTAELPDGRVRLSVSALNHKRTRLGSVLLVHDLSFMDRREATTRNLLLGGFFVLALSASVFTLVAARVAWRGWTLELRRALSGRASAEFRPLVRDVRSLVERLADERKHEANYGAWSSSRLRETLVQ